MESWSKFRQGLEALSKAEVCLPICDVTALDGAIALNPTLTMLAQRRWLTQLKLNALADPDNANTADLNPILEAKLTTECLRKLAEFRQLLANKMQSSQAEFIQWRRSRQKDLQQKLHATESQIILAIREGDLNRDLVQLKLKSDASKSGIWAAISQQLLPSPPSDLELSALSIVPVKVLLHIPKMFAEESDLDRSAICSELAQRLNQFCQLYTAQDRAVDLLTGNWFNEAFSENSAVEEIFELLRTEPIVVLETVISADVLHLNLAYWGLSCSEYRYKPGVLEIDLRECINSVAKKTALEWWRGLKQSKSQGITPEQYSQNFDPASIAIFIDNLKAIEQEQNVRHSGIAINPSEMLYAFCPADLTRLQQNIAKQYCILLGLQLDEYFLFNSLPKSRLRPLLPQILSQLIDDLPPQETTQVVRHIVMRYQTLYITLGKKEPLTYPELCIDLALSLAHLPEPSWAKGQIVQSISSWLELRGITLPDRGKMSTKTFDELLNATIANATLEDWEYLTQLNRCLVAIGYDRKISFADSYFERGKIKYLAEDYVGAIVDFSQAIHLDNLYAEAYLQRGLAYTRLGECQPAINDYSKAIEVQPNSAKAYNYRGNAYRELGECQAAIADYDRALEIEPDLRSAQSDRRITLDMLAEVDRHHLEENSHSREFEYEVVRLNSNGKEINRRTNCAKLLVQDIGPVSTVNIEMVYIPNGVCFMGSSEREPGRELNEGPQHWVTISSFFISKSPVTQAQWQAVANLPPSDRSAPLTLNPDPSHFKGLNLPVENISWFEAVEFCARLAKASGLNYRLPSEAEWEYACRGGTKTPFSYGHTISTDLANYDGTSAYGFGTVGIYRKETVPVDSFQVGNPFGLFDMHGQVWEWCADPWHPNYQSAPSDGSVWEIDGDYEYRIVRGGSWFNNPSRCRATVRGKYAPDVWLNQIGFRIAMSI